MTTTELPAWATAVTVRIPLSPTIAFDHFRRRAFERFGRLEQRVHDDFAQELAELDAYLDSLRILTPPQAAPQKRRRWHR